MSKKIMVLICSLLCIFTLCSCQADIDFQKNENNIAATISLDNNLIRATQSDAGLFESNDFTMSIDGDKLVVGTTINYNSFEEDFSKRVSFLKQIIEVINPELKSQLEKIDITPHRISNGYGFAGVDEISFEVNGLDDYAVNLTGTSDNTVSINGNNYFPESNIEGTLSGNNPSFEFIDNENISSVRIETNIKKDKIVSEIKVSLKEGINESSVENFFARNRISDYTLSSKFITFMIEYTSPNMFNSLHNTDLYNIFGGLYMISIDDNGVYSQNGNVDIKAIDNCGVEEVSYLVKVNSKNIENGDVVLTAGNGYKMNYKVSDTGSFVVTLIVIASVACVVGGFVYMAKKRK